MLALERHAVTTALAVLSIVAISLVPFVAGDVCEVKTTENDDFIFSGAQGRTVLFQTANAVDFDVPVVRIRDNTGLKVPVQSLFDSLAKADTSQQSGIASLQSSLSAIQTAVQSVQSDLRTLQGDTVRDLQSKIINMQANITSFLMDQLLQRDAAIADLRKQLTQLAANLTGNGGQDDYWWPIKDKASVVLPQQAPLVSSNDAQNVIRVIRRGSLVELRVFLHTASGYWSTPLPSSGATRIKIDLPLEIQPTGDAVFGDVKMINSGALQNSDVYMWITVPAKTRPATDRGLFISFVKSNAPVSMTPYGVSVEFTLFYNLA